MIASEPAKRRATGSTLQRRRGHSKVAVTLDIYSHLLPTMQDGGPRQFENLLHQQKPKNGFSQATVGKAASS